VFVVGVRTDGDLSQVRGHIMAVNDEPVISVADGGIFCLRATLAGHYKCYRQVVFTAVYNSDVDSVQTLLRRFPQNAP